jgi:hypothetical protein
MGQVALFFYIVHVPFIKVVSKIYHTTIGKEPSAIVFYTIWLIMVIILYYISRVYYEYKIARKNDPGYWWLKYL